VREQAQIVGIIHSFSLARGRGGLVVPGLFGWVGM
jgi:hypothetical protein